jgi:lipopolysaccharide/colanic/teichoic acid biosynthesis glycosyltransferase
LRRDPGNQENRALTRSTREAGDASLSEVIDRALKRAIDIALAGSLLVLASPVIAVLAIAIRVESRGPAIYRCRRVGRNGRGLQMLKFRKMRDGAAGPALCAPDDARFTRLGGFLASTKLDELPQLWNVVKGEMSLVGPRPEDPRFVELHRDSYDDILSVRPGITGLSQIAFARESEVLDPDDRVGHYTRAILPQKIRMDRFYAEQRSLSMDMRIIWWTLRAVAAKCEVAVHRETGRLGKRVRRQEVTEIVAENNSPVILERQAS